MPGDPGTRPGSPLCSAPWAAYGTGHGTATCATTASRHCRGVPGTCQRHLHPARTLAWTDAAQGLVSGRPSGAGGEHPRCSRPSVLLPPAPMSAHPVVPPPPAFAPAPPCCGTAGGPGGRRLRQRLRCCPGPAWPRRQPWTRRLLVGCRGGTPARSALPSTPDLCVRLLEKCLILPSPVAGGCPGKDRSGRGVGGAGETPRCHHLPGTLPASTSPKACACDGRHRSRSKQ